MILFTSLIVAIITTTLLAIFTDASILTLFVAFLLSAIATTLLFVIFAGICALFINKKKPVEKPSKFHLTLLRIINNYLLQFSGLKIIVNNKELLKKDQKYLVVCNHLSNYDPMVILKVLSDRKIVFASKPQNFDIFIAGAIMHKAGCMPIIRDDNKASLKTIIQLSHFVKEYNWDCGIFPEGQRNFTGETLLEFKHGAFKIAQKANCPVLVMTVWGTDKVKHNFPFKTTKIYVDFLEVISAEEVTSETTNFISDKAYSIMLENLNKHIKQDI